MSWEDKMRFETEGKKVSSPLSPNHLHAAYVVFQTREAVT